MSIINFRRKEIIAKVVYYGPGLSGKTTNVQKIHESMPSETRGELTSLATEEDRTLYFDYIPIHLGNIGGFKTRFQIFTVPGQVFYEATRRIVLQGVDGVVFVADSGKDALARNRESLEDLRKNLLHYDKLLSAIPFVIQYNKRDLVQAMSVPDLNRELNALGAPTFEAVAFEGRGVLETLSRISSLVLTHLKASIEGKLNQGRKDTEIIERFDDEEVSDEQLVQNLLEQIRQVRPLEVHAEVNIVEDDDSLPVPLSAQTLSRSPGLPPLPSMSAVSSVGTAQPVEYEVSLHGEAAVPSSAYDTADLDGDDPDEEEEGDDSQKIIADLAPNPMAASASPPSFSLEDVSGPPPLAPKPPPPPGGPARDRAPAGPVANGADRSEPLEPDLRSTVVVPPRPRVTPPPPGSGVAPVSAATPLGPPPPPTPPPPQPRPAGERSTVATFQPSDAPPWDPRTSRANGGKAVAVPLGRLEVSDVGSVSRQGGAVMIPLTLKDTDSGATRSLTVRLDLSGDVRKVLNDGIPSYIHIWLMGLSAACLLALILSIF